MDAAEVDATICVEVAFSPLAGQVQRVTLSLLHGATVAQAIAMACSQSGFTPPAGLRIGIWGRLCEPTDTLRDRDRVEIYRPLSVDPKEARRQRYGAHLAAQKKR